MPPYPHRLILPSAPHLRPIIAPIDSKHLIPMPRQILLQLPRPHIPNLERRILAPANQQPPIGRKTRHVHRSHMAPQRSNKPPIASPQLDMIVPAGASDEASVGGESDVVDLLLMAEQAGDGGGGGAAAALGRFPEVHCAVVRCGHEALDDLIIDLCGFLEALLRFCHLAFLRGGDVAGVVMVGGAED